MPYGFAPPEEQKAITNSDSSKERYRRLLKVLHDNGVDRDELGTVGEAVLYVLDLEILEEFWEEVEKISSEEC